MRVKHKDIRIPQKVPEKIREFTYEFEKTVIEIFGYTTLGHIVGYLELPVEKHYWTHIVTKLYAITWDENRQETVISVDYRIKNMAIDEKGGDSK